MITSNFIKLLNIPLCLPTNPVITFAGNRGDSSNYGIKFNNTVVPPYGGFVDTTSGRVSKAWYLNYFKIYLGTGTLPPTKDDTELESGATACPTGVYSYDDLKPVITGIYTNYSSDPVTFTEIGSFAIDSYKVGILLTRSVFSEPVVIPAGESKSFTITLDMTKLTDNTFTS